MQIASYLTFNGNCREAMTFYQSCLGGELHFQTVGDSPVAESFPAHIKSAILNATLEKEKVLIVASDMVSENGLRHGNAVSLMLHCKSEKEIREVYNNLSKGGLSAHPLKATYWGALFGDLVDRYGNQWLLHYSYNS